jgi:hypothetical protein
VKRGIAALGIAVAVTLTGCGITTSQTSDGPTSAAGPTTVVDNVGVVAARTCRARQLHSTVVVSGSTMSQPFVTIALRNRTARACRLSGYPTLRAFGHGMAGPSRRLVIQIHRGSIYERTDPGPRRLVLPPHGAVSFNVGTGTAYQGGKYLLAITRLDITSPGGTSSIPVRVQMYASRPRGEPIPVGVTALQLVG